MRALALLGLILCVGCPSKDGSGKDAQTSSSGTTGTAPPVGSGPLANVEATPFLNEVWTDEDGHKLAMIYFTQSNLRISASCRTGAGQLQCAAINQLRSGQPIGVPRRELTGSISAGTKACMKANLKLAMGTNSVGAQDGFCTFPDGSMVSTGALEQYGMKILE